MSGMDRTTPAAGPTRRRVLSLAGGGVAVFADVAYAQPAWSPDRPARIIVPFGPGGTSDILARALAERLGERVGQRVIVENRPGAGGNIGAEAAAEASPDGYTLFFGGMSTNAINLSLYRRRTPDLVAQLVPVGLLIKAANVLLVNPARQDFADLPSALAAVRAAPGRFNYGSGGAGSVTHLTMELLKAAAGLDIVHVPYRGAAVPGLLSGDVAFVFDGAVSATQHVRGGTLKALGVSTAARLASLPDVPTISESGVPGFDVPSWFAVFVTPGAPPAAITRWRAEIDAVSTEPGYLGLLERNGTALDRLAPAALVSFMESERRRWAEVVARTGTRVE